MASSSSYTSGTKGQVVNCPQCHGSGTINDAQGNPKTCPTCYGHGKVTSKQHDKYMASQPLSTIPAAVKFVDCPECGATTEITDPDTGKLIDCPLCKATGYVDEDVRKKWLEDNEE